MRIVFNFICQLLIHIENWKICGHMDAWGYIMCFNMFKSCEVTYVRLPKNVKQISIEKKMELRSDYKKEKEMSVCPPPISSPHEKLLVNMTCILFNS